MAAISVIPGNYLPTASSDLNRNPTENIAKWHQGKLTDSVASSTTHGTSKQTHGCSERKRQSAWWHFKWHLQKPKPRACSVENVDLWNCLNAAPMLFSGRKHCSSTLSIEGYQRCPQGNPATHLKHWHCHAAPPSSFWAKCYYKSCWQMANLTLGTTDDAMTADDEVKTQIHAIRGNIGRDGVDQMMHCIASWSRVEEKQAPVLSCGCTGLWAPLPVPPYVEDGSRTNGHPGCRDC